MPPRFKLGPAPGVIALALLEGAQAAGVGEQHGKGVLGDGRGVCAAHVGHHDVGVGDAGHLPHPFDARARGLDPAQLFCTGELVGLQLAEEGVDVAHQRRRRLVPRRYDEFDSVLPCELGETLRVAVERGHEHFHRDPFFSCAAVHHNRRRGRP